MEEYHKTQSHKGCSKVVVSGILYGHSLLSTLDEASQIDHKEHHLTIKMFPPIMCFSLIPAATGLTVPIYIPFVCLS
jgi:hypothetical protein